MKKIAIIGANEYQNPLILRAHEMGYETHVFAWKADAIGEKTADVFHPISITEKEQIWQVCREVGVEACCSVGSDLAIHTVNYVQRKLGMPCNPQITDTIATNKYAMRQALQEAGIPCPRFMKVSAAPAESALRGYTWPLIVKPTDRSGSRGIFQVNSYNELCAAVQQAVSHSFEKCAIIEEYITGPEYSCESISFNGHHHVLALTKKYTTGAPHFIETGHIEPSDIPAEYQPAIRDSITAALDALHIEYGASHAEFRLAANGTARIIEIGSRMGGDFIGSDLVPLSTGIDYIRAVIDTACGREPDLTAKTVPLTAEVHFIFKKSDIVAFHNTPADRIVRCEIENADLDCAVTDSSNRHGYWITAANA